MSALALTHSTVVVAADDGTSPVGTDEWNAAHTITGELSVVNGGTGLATLTAHALQIGNGTSALTQLTVGAGGTVLQGVASSDPTFTATPTLGVVSSVTGQLKLAHASSANLTTIQAGNAAAARTYTWPTNFGAAGTVLTDAAGDGTLSWAAGGGSIAPLVIGTNLVEQYNSTTAQKFSVFNTRTDGSNYERGVFDWTGTSNVLTIGTEKAGTGSTRNVKFIVAGTTFLDFGVTTANTVTLTGSAGIRISDGAGNSSTISLLSGGRTTFTSGAVLVQGFQLNADGIGLDTSSGDTVLTRAAAKVAKSSGLFAMTGIAFASLPTGVAGYMAYVTDSNTTTAGATVAGGGANKVFAWHNGTNWTVVGN